jgi:hypothetical protein
MILKPHFFTSIRQLVGYSLCSLGFLAATGSWGQTESAPTNLPAITKSPQQKDEANLKKWSIYWGWNRSNYSKSDIHFSGRDHDFTLKNVEASDLPSDTGGGGFLKYYVNPAEMTIPQTNFRLAYQYNADTAFALNLDHMKYVVVQDQTVDMTGCYKNGVAAQVCNNGRQVIADNFLNFEHTDGLNVLTLELEKQRHVELFGARNAKVFALVGAGVVIPKTNATMGMIGQTRNDEFHLAGWSVGAGVGLELDVYKDVFFSTAYKAGYVNLPDVLTSARGDKADHAFTYQELLIAIGVRF